MHEIRRIFQGLLAVACAFLLTGPPASATMLAGGGPSASDCYVTLDVTGSKAASAANVLECQDGDAACDQDGMCNNACQFRVAVCVDQPGVGGCPPPAALQTVSGKAKGVPIPVPSPPSGSTCGPTTDLMVPQKPPTKKGERPGKIKVVLIGVALSGKPRRDRDKIRLTCLPRPDDEPCPIQTTTSTSTTTNTTALTTLTTIVGSSTSTTSTSVNVATRCCQAVGACFDAASADAEVKCPLFNCGPAGGPFEPCALAPAGQFCNAMTNTCGPTQVHAANCCQCPANPLQGFPHPQYCFETNNASCGDVCTLTAGATCGPVSESCGGP